MAVTSCAGQVQADRPKKVVHFGGRVVDGATGKPVEAAQISLSASIDRCVWRTDSDGKFSFWAPVETNQQMIIAADDYASVSLVVRSSHLHDVPLHAARFRVVAPEAPVQWLAPSQAVAPAFITADSGPRLSGRGKSWSPWYQVGLGKAPSGYTVQRVEFWLSGDRSCNAGAECREVEKNDERVLWEFRLQGHDEIGAPARAASKAHLRVSYRSKP